jgi:transcriptional regulator with XRE-family HTH domain
MDELQRVRHLEMELNQAKRALARSLRTKRAALNLTLGQVGKAVRVDASTVLRIERAEFKNPKHVEKIVRLYVKLAA